MAVRRERLAWAVAVLIALGAPAGAQSAPTPRTVRVIASEYRFQPARLVFKRGVAYRLHIENRGKEMHEFTAPEFFKAVKLQSAEPLNADHTEIELPPGVARDLYFVPQHSGHYPLRCSDHDWAGMIGEITVK